MCGDSLTLGNRALTVDEFRRLPDGEGRMELVRGAVVREPPPGAEHGHVGFRLARLLAEHVEENDLGVVATLETGFVLQADPPTVRAPDVAFIARDRLPAGEIPTGYWPLSPDLAVEVVSPSDRSDAVDEKVLDYLRCGVREVWIVHPRSRSVTVYRSRADLEALGEDEELGGGDLIPRFSVKVGDLFP